MARIWIDVEDASGNVLGDGPITTATEWSFNPRLDEAGTFSFTMPAGDPRAALLANKRVVRCYLYEAGEIREVGAGIVDSVVTDAREPTMLRVSGPDLLAELATRIIPELTVCEQGMIYLNQDPDLSFWKGAVRWVQDGPPDEGTFDVDLTDAHDGNVDSGGSTVRLWRYYGYHEWLYVGCDARFDEVHVWIDAPSWNDAETALEGQYYNGEGWYDLPDMVDGTKYEVSPGVWATMRIDGAITFTRPTDWARYRPTIVEGEWFWVRFRVGAGSTTVEFSLREVAVWGDIPTDDGVNQIMAYAPDTWTKTGYAATTSDKYLELTNESVLACLRALAEQGGQDGSGDPVREHFRLGTGREIDWLSSFSDSGLRAENAIDPGDGVCLIRDLRETRDTAEAVTRIYPYSNDGIGLALTTRTPPATYTLDTTNGYLESVNGVAALGRIDAALRFSDLSMQQTDSWYLHPSLVANAVYDRALEYLRTHEAEAYFYNLELAHVRADLLPGHTIRVVYHEYRDGYHAVDIDATLYVLATHVRVDDDGLHTVGCEVGTVDRSPQRDTSVLVSTIQDVRRMQAGLGGVWNITAGASTATGDTVLEGPGISVTGDGREKTVGLGGDMVLLYDDDRTPVAEYATITLALAAADSGDVVQPQAGTYAESFTIPAGVELVGAGRDNTVITGTVTLGDGAVLRDVTVDVSGDDAGDLVAIVPPSGDGEMAYVIGCDIIAHNATGNGYAAYGYCSHLTLKEATVSAQSAGVDSNPWGGASDTTTVYFDGSDGVYDPDAAWTDDANAVDGDTETFAYTTTAGSVDANYLRLAGTNAPGSGTTITQVRARVLWSQYNGIPLQHISWYTTGPGEELGSLEDQTAGIHWSDWVTLSTPSGGWSWPTVQALEAKSWKVSGLAVVTVYRVELDLTYQSGDATPYVVGCAIPNAEGRAGAIPLYSDRASWRTDYADGLPHADDFEAGASHHPKSHAHDGVDGSGTVDHDDLTNVTSDQHHARAHNLDSESDHPDVDASAKADGYVQVWRDAAGKHVYEAQAGAGSYGYEATAGYAETIGDAVNTVYTVTHSLGTWDVLVAVWDLDDSPVELVDATVEALSADAVRLTFESAPATDQYRVLVLAANVGVANTVAVEEADGTPAVAAADTIKVPNGTLTDNGDGSVSLDYAPSSHTHVEADVTDLGPYSEPGHQHVEADITDLDHTDAAAIHDNVSGEIHAIASKATPVDTDEVVIEDSEDTWAKKRVALSALPGGGGAAQVSTINVIIDGGGSAITTGIKGDVVVDFACTITAATLLADQSGDIVVDIWKDTYANYPPTDADSITSATPPTLSSAVKSQDTTLTDWTTAINAGDVLRFNVDSAATVERVTLALTVQRS